MVVEATQTQASSRRCTVGQATVCPLFGVPRHTHVHTHTHRAEQSVVCVVLPAQCLSSFWRSLVVCSTPVGSEIFDRRVRRGIKLKLKIVVLSNIYFSASSSTIHFVARNPDSPTVTTSTSQVYRIHYCFVVLKNTRTRLTRRMPLKDMSEQTFIHSFIHII